jgi:hypothetical protein
MLTTPSSAPDPNVLKKDIQSGVPANIEAALDQLSGAEQWQALSSAERVDLVQTLMEVCSRGAKISDAYWQTIGYSMMTLEPDFSLDIFEWMLTNEDKNVVERARKILTQGAIFRPSSERKERFAVFLRSRDPSILGSLERCWN